MDKGRASAADGQGQTLIFLQSGKNPKRDPDKSQGWVLRIFQWLGPLKFGPLSTLIPKSTVLLKRNFYNKI